MNLTKWLKKTRGEPKLRAIPSLAPWTQVEKEMWAKFLASHTGQKLVARLRAAEAYNAIAGAQDVLHTAHSAGRTVGYSDAIKHLISLSISCSRDDTAGNAIGAPGAAPADENHAQAESRELAELLERMSP